MSDSNKVMQKIQFFFPTFLLLLTSMAADSSSSSEAKFYLVYTERPDGQEPEAYNIKILSSVLGSEEAAKGALIYSYKYVVNGFSAKLTPDQVSRLSKQPEVLQVVPADYTGSISGTKTNVLD